MLNTETMLTLEAAAAKLPNRPHRTTLWRWCREGIRGIRLEYRAIGRSIYTSMEALERFSRTLAEAAEVVIRPQRAIAAVARHYSSRRREESFQGAETFLAELGI